MNQSLIKAHDAARYNRNMLESDSKCGCFHCLRVYSPSEIWEWIPETDEDEEVTALCPHCGISSVISERSGFPLEQAFLERMYVRWFAEASIKTDRGGKMQYTEESMKNIHKYVRRLVKIVNELEGEFPGRHFTLDGHLVGSIGEVVAAYHYGIKLFAASTPIHDGQIGRKKVQIKTTQKNNIVISREPDYLIVLYMDKTGRFYEIFNGSGREPWESASKRDSHNNRHIVISKLMKLDMNMDGRKRIKQIHPIEKMKMGYISK